MSTNREEILANFQSLTGIENVEDSIMWLENANWDLLTAVRLAIPQESQIIPSSYGRNAKKQNGRVPIVVAPDFLDVPSTSETNTVLHVNIHYLSKVHNYFIPDSVNAGCVKSLIYTTLGIPPCQQILTGWPAGREPSNDTLLSSLNLPGHLDLHLENRDPTSGASTVTEMDITEEPIDVDCSEDSDSFEKRNLRKNKQDSDAESDEDFTTGSRRTRRGKHIKRRNSRRTDVEESPDSDSKVENKNVGVERQDHEAGSGDQDLTNGGRRTGIGLRRSKRRDSQKHMYQIKIYDEVNHKEFMLTMPGTKTVGHIKREVYIISHVPVKQQLWSGWPGKNIADSTLLSELDLDIPFHCLSLQSASDSGASSSASTNTRVERVRNPVFVDLVSDSSPEDYEDASESFAAEDEMFAEELSSPTRISPLIPDDVEDEIAGAVHFIDGYNQRYGPTVPNFLSGTLDDAIREACFRSARERRMLAIYLHHDGSVLSNVFCTELLGSETILQTFANYFVVWGWDVTNRSNRDMLLNSVTNLLGSTITDTIQDINTDQFPALLIVSRSRSHTELLNIIYGNIGLNELLSMLMHAVDVFSDMQETEIKEEDERAARELIKLEQDKAYQQSLQMDRAKEEARKQQLLLESQEQERLKQEEQIEQEQREVEKQVVASRLPDEPDKDASGIVTIRFRHASGDPFERRFLMSDKLQVVFDYLLIKEFRISEFRLVTTWPKRDITEMDASKTLEELKFYPQECLILEAR